MRILVHVCCGPCAVYPMQHLALAGHELTGFFHNPNIHPYQEFRRRLEAAASLSEASGWPLVVDEHYGLREYLRQINFNEDGRCHYCYDMRLEHVARQAKIGGYDAFTTTLLYSRYQNHELIRERATWWAMKSQVDFYYEDFRLGWQEGIDASIRMGLYRQPYCGCIYSEQERYDKLWRKQQNKQKKQIALSA
ncbi:MAG: epoxyqueuosine reductase QueH [Desulfobulbaceae bacterium]|nr:epoxyqueuosine reductase QueH [Desulfobulbaceae bacterium]